MKKILWCILLMGCISLPSGYSEVTGVHPKNLDELVSVEETPDNGMCLVRVYNDLEENKYIVLQTGGGLRRESIVLGAGRYISCVVRCDSNPVELFYTLPEEEHKKDIVKMSKEVMEEGRIILFIINNGVGELPER